MIINSENVQIGNKAMASVLLLYYHLLTENGFTNDQTVFIESDFNAFDFLNVKLDKGEYQLNIDADLIRQGAIISLICDLNDMISDYSDDYLSQPITKKIFAAFQEGKLSAIAETEELFSLFQTPKDQLDYTKYKKCLQNIYESYVVNRFKKILHQHS